MKLNSIQRKVVLIGLQVFLVYHLFAQTDNNVMYDDFSIFEKDASDKYYSGWLDRRAQVASAFLNYNFDVVDALKERDATDTFDYGDAFIFFDLRIAKDFIIYRNDYIGVGGFGGMEALMFARKQRIDDVSFYIYDFSGEFGPFVDIWLQPIFDISVKVRFFPFFHQSTHFGDGYKGTIPTLGTSYEFFGINVYYFNTFDNHYFSPYSGVEVTYRYAGNGAPAFKLHVGNDYRYQLSKPYDINFILGLNLAYIYDHKDDVGLIDNQSSFAVALGAGIEFHSYVLSLKYSYGRGRGATTYFTELSSIGLNLSIML